MFDLFTFDVCGNEDIFAYETASGYTRQQLHADIVPGYNSGRGDLGAGLPVCEGGPGEVSGLQVSTASGGADLLLTWDADPSSVEYAVFDDFTPDGQFGNVAGLAVSGFTDLQLPMPGGDAFFLVAGVSAPCIGPK